MTMLVITRRPGETFWVGEDVEIKVFEAVNGMLRIGIEAPPDVQVMRGEVLPKEEQLRRRARRGARQRTATDNVA